MKPYSLSNCVRALQGTQTICYCKIELLIRKNIIIGPTTQTYASTKFIKIPL